MDLKQETLDRIDRQLTRYPDKRSMTLPMLHLIQEEKGYISKEAMEWIAQKLDLQPIHVYEVVTFYPMFRQEPIGKKQVRVCRTLSCALKGGYQTCEVLRKELNCELNHTSQDGNFSLEFVECIADCGNAPVIHVDDTMHAHITPDKAKAFAESLKNEVEQITSID